MRFFEWLFDLALKFAPGELGLLAVLERPENDDDEII